MRFSKWHGIGNDYLVVREADAAELDAAAATALCDRHFGIGADGILVLGPSDVADARMVIWNPDGSHAEMCGNGIRMAARFLREQGMVDADTFSVETTGGVVHPTVNDDGTVSVEMGRLHDRGTYEVTLQDGEAFTGHDIGVGNPHFVIAADPHEVDLHGVGPRLEHHDAFPNRTNVEFYRVDDERHVTMRVWERGVGETLACGSGACAVGLAAVLDAGCSTPVTVSLPGGDLQIDVTDGTVVRMTGPALHVFDGDVDVPALVRTAARHTPTTAQEALA